MFELTPRKFVGGSNQVEMPQEISRGYHDEIYLATLPKQTKEAVETMVEAASISDHVDEHGTWDFGVNLDKKKRGWALNWALYGFGPDIHSHEMLAVIQVRQYYKQCANWWPRVRKNYFLLGHNEDGTVFAHAVEAMVVRSAVNRGVDVIKACQDWLWEADYARVVRQGDIGLVPRKCRPKGVTRIGPVVVEQSHLVTAAEVVVDGDRLFALDPYLVHLPGTHPDATTKGWVLVATAKRAATWNFAAETVD